MANDEFKDIEIVYNLLESATYLQKMAEYTINRRGYDDELVQQIYDKAINRAKHDNYDAQIAEQLDLLCIEKLLVWLRVQIGLIDFEREQAANEQKGASSFGVTSLALSRFYEGQRHAYQHIRGIVASMYDDPENFSFDKKTL